jgi:AraC-like DNA-binding protein
MTEIAEIELSHNPDCTVIAQNLFPPALPLPVCHIVPQSTIVRFRVWQHSMTELGLFKERILDLEVSITEFPTQCTLLVSARTNNIAKIVTMEYVFDLSDPYDYRIEKALDLLNRELLPNFESIALRAGLTRSTLSRRFRGVTTSRAEANSEYRQCLTIAQEEALIKQINKLLIRNMPPTSQIVKNLAKEIYGRKVYKN